MIRNLHCGKFMITLLTASVVVFVYEHNQITSVNTLLDTADEPDM
jgi:hypothetical protein